MSTDQLGANSYIPIEEDKSVEKEVEIPVCELRKSNEDVREVTSVAAESRPIRSKRALARYKDSFLF